MEPEEIMPVTQDMIEKAKARMSADELERGRARIQKQNERLEKSGENDIPKLLTFITGESEEAGTLKFSEMGDFHKKSLRQTFEGDYMEAIEMLVESGISTSIYLTAYEDYLSIDLFPSPFFEDPAAPLPWHHVLIVDVNPGKTYLREAELESAFDAAWEKMRRYIEAQAEEEAA
jgi:hypothetical protein